jgi:hypothetical protein
MKNSDSYDLYVTYCATVDCNPAPYEKWLVISDNPTEYESIEKTARKLLPLGISAYADEFGEQEMRGLVRFETP